MTAKKDPTAAPARPNFENMRKQINNGISVGTGIGYVKQCEDYITWLEGQRPIGDTTPNQNPANFLSEEQLRAIFAEWDKRALANNWKDNPPVPAASAALFREIAVELFGSPSPVVPPERKNDPNALDQGEGREPDSNS